MKTQVILRCGVAFCVGTVITELILLATIVATGGTEKVDPNVLASILWGIDQVELAKMEVERLGEQSFDDVGLDAVAQDDEVEILNLDMRDRSLQNAVDDLNFYGENLDIERERYESMRLDFEDQLARIEGAVNNTSLIQLRDTIANLDPAQAKDQIMTFLQRSDDSGDQEIANDVVVMIKTMPIDKRKKIFSEFQTDAEKQRLGFIIHEIRVGHPEIPLIQKVRKRLSEFDSQDELDST